jgi:hypothetical protein
VTPQNASAGSQATARARPYAAAILEQIPRVLGMMDREPLSPTAGCCDRTYWAWKFVDFPRSRFQEAVCVLGFVYATPLPDSAYRGHPRLLDWIDQGLRYWTTLQHADGSFDEAYPFERSLAATAFTAFYVGEALRFAGDALPAATVARTRDSMLRAGAWLCRNDETHGFLSNHLAAAAAALQHVHHFSGDDACARRARYFVERILDHQSAEGWYDEYGGADPGYQTHGSFYLTRYWQLTNQADVLESLLRANRFLAHFVHCDGSTGGEYASRNTQTYYPAAFAMLARRDPTAAWIVDTMHASVGGAAAVSLRSVDAYNYFPFLNNFVFAYLAHSDTPAETLAAEPSAGPGLSWFPEAGIARIRRARYDAYVGAAKGGVTKVFDRHKRRLVYSDCGYIGHLRDGRLISSQYEDHRRVMHVHGDRIEIEGTFVHFSRPTLSPALFVAFRLFTLSLGRLPRLARWLKERLVTVLIYRKRALDIRFTRTIELDETSVRVSDSIVGPDGARVARLCWGASFSTIHMGSSRYFSNNELDEMRVLQRRGTDEIDPNDIAPGLTVERMITFGDQSPTD